MSSFPDQFLLLLSISISLTMISAQSNSDTDSKGWSSAGVYVMITLNLMATIPITLSLIHFIYSLCTIRDRFPINRILVSFQFIIYTCTLISSFTYGFFRSNIFINNIHTPSSCFLIYCFSVFTWGVGRYFCLLSFLMRIALSFKGSVLGIIYNIFTLSFIITTHPSS